MQVKKTKKLSVSRNIFFDITNLDLIVCFLVVFGLFSGTLLRPWLIYDEKVLLDGLYFPSINLLSDFFEIINNFSTTFNVTSSNTIYSSNYIIRTCPFAQIFGIVISSLFKKNAFSFHLFSLSLHLINTCLVYFILKIFLNKKGSELHPPSTFNRCLLIILTLIWATHPVIVEPVLLATNSGALFSYMFFFAFLLEFIINGESTSLIRKCVIPVLFLIPMLTNEYLITLPLVLLVVSFYETSKNYQFKKAFNKSIEETLPYFIGFVVYLVFFLLMSNYRTSQIYMQNQLIIFLERIFWLLPQIFFHFLKLILYPSKLSVDQSVFVHLGKILYDPYSIFCIIFCFSWLFFPLYLHLTKRKFSNLFFMSWTFFFALLPFLHLFMPSYTLANERYLYCPLVFLIIGIAKILTNITSTKNILKPALLTSLSVILILLLLRSHYRTQDWKDNYTFINSSYKTSKDVLFKAIRLGMLGKATSILEPYQTEKIQNYFIATLELLEKAKEETLKNKTKYQKTLPLVIKSYGLDYDSQLTRIAFLETSSKCLDLNEDYKIGLNILEPYMKKLNTVDPRILELYSHLLLLDKNYNAAEKVLLKANKTFPRLPFLLNDLIDFYTFHKKNKDNAEKYILEGLKFYPYDPAFLLKATIFFKEEKNEALAAQYAALYALRTQSKEAYMQALVMYLNTENIKEAKKIVPKLLKLDNIDPETLYFASKYYYKIKEYQKALNLLTDAFINAKKLGVETSLSFDIANALAKLYLFLGDKDKAALLTQDILALAGNDLISLIKLAELYKSLGLIEEEQLLIQKIKSIKKISFLPTALLTHSSLARLASAKRVGLSKVLPVYFLSHNSDFTRQRRDKILPYKLSA